MKFETSNQHWWDQIPQSLRTVPSDLAIVFTVIVLVNVVFRVPGLRDASVLGVYLRPLVAIPFLLFVPGYVLVSILFPGNGRRAISHAGYGLSDRIDVQSIDAAERIALSFGMSVAIAPLFALVVGTVWSFSPFVVLTGLTVLLVAGIGVASLRRFRLQPEDRFSLELHQRAADLRRRMAGPTDRVDRFVTVLLVVGILAAVVAVGYAVATPYQSGGSSMLFLTTENETGATVASGYPTEFTAGESQPLTVGIRNDEETRQQYSIVVTLERVETTGTDTRVVESQEIDRLQPVVAAGQRWTQGHSVTPQLVGEELRLHYYLYKGDTAPSEPNATSAYRDTYIWIDVTE